MEAQIAGHRQHLADAETARKAAMAAAVRSKR
jgi:hypothetical protein